MNCETVVDELMRETGSKLPAQNRKDVPIHHWQPTIATGRSVLTRVELCLRDTRPRLRRANHIGSTILEIHE
jgi:hypothetical protein